VSLLKAKVPHPKSAVPNCLQEAEESLCHELHRRTSTILGLQAKVDGQDAALAAASEQQAALQEQLQVCLQHICCCRHAVLHREGV
jgi:hypothetical protein